MSPGARPRVHVVATPTAALPLLFEELRRVLVPGGLPLVGFATGATYAPFLAGLAERLRRGELPGGFAATHLDEYVGYPPDRPGGMVHELLTACPPLRERLQRGAFLPVPCADDPEAIAAHAARLERAGGIALQFVGIGRNGHIGFNEPGTPFEVGFHVATLAAATRDDARARFAPDEPPLRAVTAGPATILAARRVVLCAFGAAKAPAVAAALEGDLSPLCPASVLRRHPDRVVVLDAAAAAALAAPPRGEDA
ncbi:MAG: 6-phosphogluconolactonase [Planctomycetes bacterium]|nr:6-phosphogluconolactonase [Planctomycetota bacterium]